MTPATLLALARAVYPQNDVHTYETIGGGIAWKWRKEPHDRHFTVWKFDPLTNPAQTLAVLCWITSKTCIDWHKPDCKAIGGEHHIILCDYDAAFSHDNTPASLAAAIVKAAGKVIEEGQ